MRSVPLILLISLCTFATFAGEISEFDLQSQFIGAAITNRGYRRSFTEANGENDSQLLVRRGPAQYGVGGNIGFDYWRSNHRERKDFKIGGE